MIFADPFLLDNVSFHKIWSSNNIVAIIIFSKNTEIKMSVKYTYLVFFFGLTHK